MIRILGNSYSDEEKVALYDAFSHAFDRLMSTYCEGPMDKECEHCRYKHVCYDITKATEYADDMMRSCLE